jgi:hypothetical protein
MFRTKMRKNKAQEEIVGFVLILMVVVIIFLVYLGIVLRKPTTNEVIENPEIAQFLDSVLVYTTNCSHGIPNYAKINTIIKDCYYGIRCDSGEKACDVLESTLNQIFSESWEVGEQEPYKGYEFKAIYGPETSPTAIAFISRLPSGETCTDQQKKKVERLITGGINVYFFICENPE